MSGELEDFFTTACEIAREMATREISDPRLVLEGDPAPGAAAEGAEHELFYLAGIGRDQLPVVVRTLVGARDARYAGLITEGYALLATPDDPRAAHIARGALRVSDLPPDQRIEVLTVVAQDRALRVRWCAWRILPDRGLAPLRESLASPDGLESRFLPLFLFHLGMAPPFNLDETRARRHCRQACVALIDQLGLGTIEVVRRGRHAAN